MEKILILEHDYNDLLLIQRELKKSGLEYVSQIVDTEETYCSALKNFDPSIILSDYSLPGFDGRTAFKIKMETIPDVPFIIVSGNIGEENSIELIKKGVTDYVLKDSLFTLNIKLKRALKDALDKEDKAIAEKRLAESETFLKEAQRLAKMGNWNFDFRTDKLTWSDELYNVFDTDNKTFLETHGSFIHLIDESDRPLALSTSKHAQETGEPFNIQYRITTAKGEKRIIEEFGYGEKDKDGKVIRLFGTAQDITQRRKAEIALQQSEARLKGIIASQTNYILRTDLQGNYTYCNQKFINDFGWLHSDDNVELIGFNCMASIMPYHHEAVQDLVKKCFANPNQVFQIEIDKPAKNNGIKTTLWDFILLTDQEGRPEEVQCAGINITDRKREADEKEKLTKDLIQRNKNHEQFSYIVSHNLSAPVANILGFAELLKKENSDPGLILDIVKGMSVAAKNMDIVIKDLNEILNISKVVSENKSVVNFQDLVEDISLSIDNIIKKENVIIQSDFKSVDNMLSIKTYLYSIFYNLILNGIKFHKPGIPPLIEIKSVRTSNGLQLIFKDNGMGIDLEKHQDKLFGLYKRFHLQVEGKGMGMFMVKTQVETLGGKISVSSEVNKGTEFTIEFENICS